MVNKIELVGVILVVGHKIEITRPHFKRKQCEKANNVNLNS